MPTRLFLSALAVACLAAVAAGAAQPKPVLWAWERPEDLRFAGDAAQAAVLSGFVQLSGDRVWARGRRFTARLAPGVEPIRMVHVQIDPRRRLDWTPALRARAAAAVLAYAKAADEVQVDFEVPASQRQVLLDLLTDVRAGLPATTRLSMTALASWCETESWLDAAPVDEIVPMLFRLGPRGAVLRARLETGGDFANLRCRTAIGVSVDAPIRRLPAGRRLYLFDPKSWSAADFAAVMGRLGS